MVSETKSQFARDDPAFLVLLIVSLFGKWYLHLNIAHSLIVEIHSHIDRIHMDAELDI